ncbi:MAG TPA: hypothetical protein VGV09_09655 [Steroidobacteraceae bacterium]|nr:hypothetical protein [Steroidobacteraceae bacterium]
MKKAPIGLPIVFILAFMPVADFANAAEAQEQQISTRDLRTLQIPGKVANVVWTVRPERCTLQIVFPNAGAIAQATADHPKLPLRKPSVQAWLLRADGSAITSIGRWEPRVNTNNIRQPLGVEILIAFPRMADTEAVAVALRVDDAFLIERLGGV